MMFLLGIACDGGKAPDTADSDSTTSTESSPPDDTGPTTVTDFPACLDANALGVLSAHVDALAVIAEVRPASATATGTTPFYQLPGVDAARYYSFNLSQPCEDAVDLDPNTADGVVYYIECLGKGPWWVVHAENDGDEAEVSTFADDDGALWVVDRGRMEIYWAETPSLAVTWDIRALTGPDGRDWTMTEASATLDGLLDLEETFPTLHPEGPLVLSLVDSAGGLTVADATIATWNGTAFVDADCKAGE